jgi:hypothetical protein
MGVRHAFAALIFHWGRSCFSTTGFVWCIEVRTGLEEFLEFADKLTFSLLELATLMDLRYCSLVTWLERAAKLRVETVSWQEISSCIDREEIKVNSNWIVTTAMY